MQTSTAIYNGHHSEVIVHLTSHCQIHCIYKIDGISFVLQGGYLEVLFWSLCKGEVAPK